MAEIEEKNMEKNMDLNIHIYKNTSPIRTIVTYEPYNGNTSQMIDYYDGEIVLTGFACWAYICFEREVIDRLYCHLEYNDAQEKAKLDWMNSSVDLRNKFIGYVIKKDLKIMNVHESPPSPLLKSVEESLINDLNTFIMEL